MSNVFNTSEVTRQNTIASNAQANLSNSPSNNQGGINQTNTLNPGQGSTSQSSGGASSSGSNR